MRTFLFILLLLSLQCLNAHNLCFKNWRYYQSGTFRHYPGVNNELNTWLDTNGNSIEFVDFGYGDMVDSSGSGSYAWILYRSEKCL